MQAAARGNPHLAFGTAKRPRCAGRPRPITPSVATADKMSRPGDYRDSNRDVDTQIAQRQVVHTAMSSISNVHCNHVLDCAVVAVQCCGLSDARQLLHF